MTIDPETALAAFARRDRAYDGRFVVGVSTTGIYCKPSCPARRPRPEHISLHAYPAAARAAGLRACLRCRPDDAPRDSDAVARAAALLDCDHLSLTELAAAVGYAPHHFHRLFRRATGVTPAAYARAAKARRAGEALDQESNVTEAIYAAGYAAPSRFYDDTRRLGMTPSAWRNGGAGVTIRWTEVATSLGPLLVAASERGLVRVAFDQDAAWLQQRFPNAAIAAGGPDLEALARQVVAQVEHPDRDATLPLDVRGTAFQEAVWAALQTIPPGTTLTYAQLATAVGRPGAARAAGSACGANPVAIAIPCHRILPGSGGVGGYAWGPDRKRALLDREARNR